MRLCLDVNVWVNYCLSIAHGRGLNTAAGGLAQAVFTGTCAFGPVPPVVSHAMLDTLERTLRRIPVTAPFADMARDQIEAAAGAGHLAHPPWIIAGGTAAQALLDQEDAAVLNAAMAGQAQVSVTNNIADFIAGPRARMRTTILSTRDGQPDVFRLDHPKVPNGLIVVMPFKAAAWLIHGEQPPDGVEPVF